jgi:hypothetical protein
VVKIRVQKIFKSKKKIMKKIIFLFFLPLWGLGGFDSALASVTVTPLGVNYNARTVTFRVEYAAAANNRSWVWIDLCPVPDVTPGAFQKAIISAVSVSGGSWDNTSLNGRGFYVTTTPSTVTATLSNAVGKFNWCAYGSDYPPNAVENGSSYTLKGSPPFILTPTSGTVEVNERTYSGSTITALTDATGCPGVLCSKHNEAKGLLGCCTGTTECSGTCKTSGTTTTNTTTCTGICNTAYVAQIDQCGTVINNKYGTYTYNSCTSGCSPNCASCAALAVSPYHYAYLGTDGTTYWCLIVTNPCGVLSSHYAAFENVNGSWTLVGSYNNVILECNPHYSVQCK